MTTAARKPGFEVIAERFPNARELWSLLASNDAGYVNAFSVTAYEINGRVVLLQEFGDDRGHSWDVFVPASDSNEIDKTLADLEAILAGEPVECRTKRCDYYTHYLAYGPAELTHEGFHAASKNCAEAQRRASEYFDQHPQASGLPTGLKRWVEAAEERVRA